MSVTVGLHQPNYLPWLGFFDKMARSNVFVLFDDVQFPRGRSYASRTKIINGKPCWLSVPVKKKGQMLKINQMKIDITQNWTARHWQVITEAYSKTPLWNKPNPYFEEFGEQFKDVYTRATDSLIHLNTHFIVLIRELLGIKTPLVYSSAIGDSTLHGLDRIIDIIKAVGGTTYIAGNGSGSKRYVDTKRFGARGIEIRDQNFTHPVYEQRGDEFVPGLSILDMFFNCGLKVKGILLDV